jgi:hypothetical protein
MNYKEHSMNRFWKAAAAEQGIAFTSSLGPTVFHGLCGL